MPVVPVIPWTNQWKLDELRACRVDSAKKVVTSNCMRVVVARAPLHAKPAVGVVFEHTITRFDNHWVAFSKSNDGPS